MLTLTQDNFILNLFIAFLGGLITFFASCLLPLVPTYLAYLSGITTATVSSNTKDTNNTDKSLNSKNDSQKALFINSLLFTLGFILIFTLLGVSAASLGKFFALNRSLFQQIGGLILIILGLFILNIIKPTFLQKEHKIKLATTKFQKINSFLFGATFGFAWTPCIGPILAVILLWASQANTVFQGATLLFLYGIGLGLPFILIGLFFEYLVPKLKKASKFGYYLNKFAGLIVVITGTLLLLGVFEKVAGYILINTGLYYLGA